MPFSFDEALRPKEMLQGQRKLEPAFTDPQELLYRRGKPDHIDAGRVLPIAVEQFNLSVLRSRFCSDPDHARWDSRAAAKEGLAFVYPDWLVIQFTVKDASLEWVPENVAAQGHTLRPVHAPLPDNYAHSEMALFKGSNPGGEFRRRVTPEVRASSPRNNSGPFWPIERRFGFKLTKVLRSYSPTGHTISGR